MKGCPSNMRTRLLLVVLLVSALLVPQTAYVDTATPAVNAVATLLPTAAGDRIVDTAELSPEVENAIDRGLAYLASKQDDQGSWARENKCGVTSLALMAYMLKGHFPKKGIYGLHLERAVDFLIAQAKKSDGYIGNSMYEHALATLALSEAWGMSDRDEIRDVLKRAVDIIINSQNREGGWRYTPEPKDADVSVTAMQLVALASAKEAGIFVPAEVMDKARAYVKRLQIPNSGGFGYQSAHSPGFARSAAGVMSLMISGDRESRQALRGLDYLQKQPDEVFSKADYYSYGHYYAIQVMYQAGESHYAAWYPKIRDAQLKSQKKDGFWQNPGDPDPAYGTSMAILMLGVPYRYLPIYQR